MTARPGIVRPDDVDDPTIRELLEAAETGWYGDAAFFGAMARCPAIFRAIVAAFEAFGNREHVDRELLELMRLKVADTHRCGYCATVRTLDVREAVAPKEDAVFGDVDGEALTRREYLAVTLAEQLSAEPHTIDDDLFERLGTVFTEDEIVELLLFAGLEVGLDRFCIALELQPTAASEYPDAVDYPFVREE